MREIVHLQAGQCGNQIGAKVTDINNFPKFIGEVVVFFILLLRNRIVK